MDVINGTDGSNSIETVGIDDEANEESPNMTCAEKSANLDAEDTVEEVEDESAIVEDNTTTDEEPQVAEKIEVAVVTCANDESDADSSLEIFFDVNKEDVNESTKVELQIEVDKKTNEDKEEEVAVEAEKIAEQDNEILAEKEVENKVLTNGNASPTGDITKNEESAVKPPASNTLTSISDDIVILSDDEAEAEPEPATEKQESNEVERKEESKNKLDENVEKITAVAEILEDSNNSDSSNLLEISTVQEEREKERLQEKSGEEDEEDEEEDADPEADADAEADADVENEVEEEETVTENDIEVVESNLDNEIICSPPAKRSKLSEEKKDDEEEEKEKQQQQQQQNISPENTVDLNDLNKIEKLTNQQAENKTDLALKDAPAEKSAKVANAAETETEMQTEVEDIGTEVSATSITADNVVSNELKENGIELSCVKTNTPKCKESVPLQFLRKFKKRFESMNRTELEEFVSQKIVETIVYKSQFSELNKLLKTQEQITERHRNQISELSKQLRDLNMVHNRVLKDLEEHYSQIVMPVKITRAVGLQVCIPKRGEAANVGATKKEQQQQQQQLVTKISEKDKEKILTNNSLLANNATRTLSAQKLKKNQTQTEVLNRTAQPFVQSYTHFDANKPSTSNAAKEAAAAAVAAASLQIRKINITTPLVEDTDTGKILHNTNKKQNSSTKEVLPTTSIPATVYNMQNYMSSLNQLSAGAITITPAKPKEKECIDLTEDDDCIVLPATTKETPILSSHILSTNQVYRQRANIQSTIVNPTQVKTHMRNYRAPTAATGTTSTSIPALNLNANAVARKSQPSNMSFVSSARSVNTTAPPLVMIPTNTQSAQQNTLKRKLQKQTHPAPLPYMPPPILKAEWKKPPPRPSIRIDTADKGGIVISWTMDDDGDGFAECVSYQIYAYQQTSAQPQTEFWRYVGDVKAMLLPMAVTLTQFQEGQRYFFAVRAVDVHKRFGPFSAPKTWA